ncbi:MAG: hypothetical protein R6V17_07780 [Halanaerobacter sp.]
MEREDFTWEDLADKLGLSKELMQQMGIEKLTPEQIQMLHTVIDLHAGDKQGVNDFAKEMGLEAILNNLPNLKREEMNDQDNLSNIMEEIKKITADKDLSS